MAENEVSRFLNEEVAKAQEGDRDALEHVIQSVLTWVYRIAANHLVDWRRSRLETQMISFDEFGKDLEEGLTEAPKTDDSLLYQEIRIGCTLGMLSCLDRSHRIAYILGDILEMNSTEAAAVAAVEPATFRKQLERARRSIVSFMKKGAVWQTHRMRVVAVRESNGPSI
jgi:DNA-directed RNA polymerase specialized sigma24 family protein